MVKAQHIMAVGTYTSGKSKGIYLYSFDGATGKTELLSTTPAQNPSYLTVSPDKKTLYAVAENKTPDGGGGKVIAFRYGAVTHTLDSFAVQSTKGSNPCYVAVDKTGRWLTAANYSSGNFSSFAIQKDGSLKPAQFFQNKGSGPNKERQSEPHLHATVFSADGRYLYANDLGIDQVTVYTVNPTSGRLSLLQEVKTTPGGGPRHIAFSPDGKRAYLMNELLPAIDVFSVSNGRLKPIQRISTAKDSSNLTTLGGADIHVSPDGRFVYGTNRADENSIVVCKVGKDGRLSIAGFQSTLGKTPRNFNFDPTGHYLLVANQNSSSIIVFKRDTTTGLLTDTGHVIEVPNPVCIQWFR